MLRRYFSSFALATCLFGAALPPVLAEGRATTQTASLEASAEPSLHSHAVLVINAMTGEPMYQKNTHLSTPIASITKLMTAMVVLDANLPMDEMISITEAEIDRLKGTSSRLAVGTTLSRREMLLLALMSSENRASAALARTFPGGSDAFIARMNRKAKQIGMRDAVFYDATGLNSGNRATALDLAHMVQTAYQYPLIRQYSTTAEHDVLLPSNRVLHYRNSNALVREGEWQIGLSKTGYIREAGRCLVMQATVGSTPMFIVLLAADNPNSRLDDARQIKMWLESNPRTWLMG